MPRRRQGAVKILSFFLTISNAPAAITTRRPGLPTPPRQYEHGGSVTVIAFADRDLATGQYYRIKNYVSAELFLTSRAFYNDFRIELSCCYSRSGATFTRREKAAFGKLKEIAVEEGEAAAVGAALVGSTYDDVIESLSSRGGKGGARTRRRLKFRPPT